VADFASIPSSTWQNLIFLTGCADAENALTKTKIFDLRIFPIVESPDAIDRLHGKTFVEAFQIGVVGDPQLANLRKRALAIGGVPASFGNVWEPHRAVWCASFGQGPNSEAALGFMRKFDEPAVKYNTVQAANALLARRFAALMKLLVIGRLHAEGVPRGGGKSVSIPRSIWQRDRTYIDLDNGDLLEMTPRADDHTTALSRPTFTGLMLLKAEVGSITTSLVSADIGPVKDIVSRVAVRNVITKTTSRSACRVWLMELMRESPTRRPHPKNKYWMEAQDKWPGSLSKRVFDEVWNDAVENTGAVRWSAVGRPRKSQQQKPPHQ
jgi:hypothetical protein